MNEVPLYRTKCARTQGPLRPSADVRDLGGVPAGQRSRETEILVEKQPQQGVLVCDHAGRVINKFSLERLRQMVSSFDLAS